MESRPRHFKVVLMGNGTVGKTSLRRNYMGQVFKETHQMTIGADFAVKMLEVNDTEVMVQIWDLSGQPNFSQVRKLYYQGATGIILVFDLTKFENTISSITDWVLEYQSGNDNHSTDVPAILIGNKNDLTNISQDIEKQERLRETIQNISSLLQRDVQYIETSAKTGENVEIAFKTLIEDMIKNS